MIARRRLIGSRNRAGLLPKRGRGRPSPAVEAAYRERVVAFCDLIQDGLRKGDFGAAQRLINECRKSGDLPLDICAEDASRETIGLEQLHDDVPTEVQSWVDYLRNDVPKHYMPISFWDDLDVYIEVAVEKLDLRNLFEPVCVEFHVPIKNFKGWSDLNSRGEIMRRFDEHERAGRKCILLLCGDHDPGGLHITEKMRKNMKDLSRSVRWSPDNLVIIRFGLNAKFIDDNHLTWIDNLETSSGQQLDDEDHPDHDKAYVQDYIRRFGVRKCEANALVVEPEIGRQLCRDAILEHLAADALANYERKLERERMRLRRAMRRRIR
jgi:hypothetical protein